MSDWVPILAELERRRAAAKAMGGAARLAAHHGAGKLDARQRAEACSIQALSSNWERSRARQVKVPCPHLPTV